MNDTTLNQIKWSKLIQSHKSNQTKSKHFLD